MRRLATIGALPRRGRAWRLPDAGQPLARHRSVTEVGATCQTNAGTYHLPRRLITVTVTAEGRGFGIVVDKERAPYVTDHTETYCLDNRVVFAKTRGISGTRTAANEFQRADELDNQMRRAPAVEIIIASDRANSIARSSARSSSITIEATDPNG